MTLELANEPGVPRGREIPAPGSASAGSGVRAGGHTPGPGPGPGRVPATNALALCGDALTVFFRHVGPICLLSLTGALTADTLGILESQVDRLGRTPCQRVVIDAAGLTAVDESGARVLTGLHHYVEARGGRLTMTGAAGGVARMLQGTPLLAG